MEAGCLTAVPRAAHPRVPHPSPVVLCRTERFCRVVSFFQVDDQLPVNRKVRELVEMVMADDVDGYGAMCQWLLTGADCKASGSDGVVTTPNLIRLMLDLSRAKRFADLLVGVGLWHAPGHDCQRCPEVAPGTWLFHDWFALGYDPAEKERVARLKRKELKDPQIIAEVWARDCVDPSDPTVAACRYCGTVVKRKDMRSENRPHLDHVDPTIAIGSRNIVVSCRECNQKKGNRFPADAGLELRPAPRSGTAVGDAAGPLSPRHDEGPRSGSTRSAQHSGRDADGAHTAPTDQTPDHDPISARSSSDPPPDQGLIDGDSTVPARVRAGAGAWHGSGQGEGRSLGKGDGTGRPTPSSPSPGSGSGRRRKRRRSRSPRPTTATRSPQQQSLDAGSPPDGVRTAGRFGSPYHGWTGPPDVTGDETNCPAHRLPEPCRKCASDGGAQ